MFPNLNAEMARYDFSAADLADATGATLRTIKNKLDGTTEFTRIEIFKIRSQLFPQMSVDYLFTTDRQPKESA